VKDIIRKDMEVSKGGIFPNSRHYLVLSSNEKNTG
jgi:hypothetical protein